MQRRSSASSGAAYLDREQRIREIEEMARRATQRLPQIRRIILFGSMVTGIPTPRSDADLLVEVSSTQHAYARDRAYELIEAMRPLPCPVDVHVYTTEEIAEILRQEPDCVVAVALREGRLVSSSTPP